MSPPRDVALFARLDRAELDLAEARRGLEVMTEWWRTQRNRAIEAEARLAAVSAECDKAVDRWRAGVGALVPLVEVATIRAALDTS